MGTVPGERPGEMPCHGDDLGAAAQRLADPRRLSGMRGGCTATAGESMTAGGCPAANTSSIFHSREDRPCS